MKMRWVLIVIGSLVWGAAGAAKEAGKGENVQIAKFSKAKGRELIESASDLRGLRRNVREIIPEFKVAAQRTVDCWILPQGIECGPAGSGGEKCPGEIEVTIAGQKGKTKLPIDCIGPDANGDCECEVAN